MNKEVKIGILLGISIVFVGFLFGTMSKESNKHPLGGKVFFGYIPKDALPQLSWGNDDGRWYDIHSIKTIIGKDTFNANFLTDGMPGLKYVLYKGLYPPSIDTVVYVMGRYDQNGKPWIDCEASLYPLEE